MFPINLNTGLVVPGRRRYCKNPRLSSFPIFLSSYILIFFNGNCSKLKTTLHSDSFFVVARSGMVQTNVMALLPASLINHLENSVLVVITSVEEVLCVLYVCWLVRLKLCAKNYWTDFHETQWRDGTRPKEEAIKLWNGFKGFSNHFI